MKREDVLVSLVRRFQEFGELLNEIKTDQKPGVKMRQMRLRKRQQQKPGVNSVNRKTLYSKSVRQNGRRSGMKKRNQG